MKPTALKTLIITCWAVLVLCLVIKLLGGNWFELATENTKFIQFCEFVDNTMWLKMTLACLIYVGSTYLYLCVASNKQYLSLKETIVYIPIMIAKSILFWYYPTIATIMDICLITIIPLAFGKFRNWLRVLISFALLNVFQIMSLIIRNYGFQNFNDNLFVLQVLIQIDYYVMIVLTYLHNIQIKNRKEKS